MIQEVKPNDMQYVSLFSQTRVSLLNGMFDTDPLQMQMARIVEIIRGDKKLKALTEAHRAQRAIQNDESQTGIARKNAKAEAEKLKKQFPIIIPSALCEGGKSRENVKGLIPMLGFDSDHLTPLQVSQALEALRHDKHVGLATPSPSGKGLHVFLPVSGIEEVQRLWDEATPNARTNIYKYMWRQVADHVERLTGVAVDANCAKPEQAYTLAYDDAAYYNPDAVPFSIDMSGYKAPKVGRPRKAAQPTSAVADMDAILREVQRRGIHPEDGRNNYLLHVAAECNHRGLAEQQVLDWALQAMLEADFDEQEIRRTVESAYRYEDQHGTHKEQNIVARIDELLRQKALYRYNEILGQLELCYLPDSGIAGQDWHRISDRDEDTLYTAVLRQMKVRKSDVSSVLNSIGFAEQYHPLKAYIEGLPLWQPGDKDYLYDLFDHILLVHEEQREVLYFYFRTWFLRFVAQGLGLIEKNQLVVALIGLENTGKSYFCEHLLPPALRQYMQRVEPQEKIDKDIFISLSERLLMLFDEKHLSRAEADAFKSLISGGVKHVRRSYGKYHEQLKLHASMMMTSNDLQFISQEQGNRRYLPIEVASTKNMHQYPLCYEGIYAQAWYCLQHEQVKEAFTQEETARLKQLNEAYTETDACVDAILSNYSVPQPGETGKWESASNIQARIYHNGSDREAMNLTQIGRTLGKLGFRKNPKSRPITYWVHELSYTEPLGDPMGEPQDEPSLAPQTTASLALSPAPLTAPTTTTDELVW